MVVTVVAMAKVVIIAKAVGIKEVVMVCKLYFLRKTFLSKSFANFYF